MLRSSPVEDLTRALSVAGMSLDEAKAAALRLAAEGHRATRGLADAVAFLVTEAALHSAGLPPADAMVVAIALGQHGYGIIGDPG